MASCDRAVHRKVGGGGLLGGLDLSAVGHVGRISPTHIAGRRLPCTTVSGARAMHYGSGDGWRHVETTRPLELDEIRDCEDLSECARMR